MSIQEINRTILWAEGLANQYNLGVNVVVNSFVTARADLGDDMKAMNLVERELTSRHKGGE